MEFNKLAKISIKALFGKAEPAKGPFAKLIQAKRGMRDTMTNTPGNKEIWALAKAEREMNRR